LKLCFYFLVALFCRIQEKAGKFETGKPGDQNIIYDQIYRDIRQSSNIDGPLKV